MEDANSQRIRYVRAVSLLRARKAVEAKAVEGVRHQHGGEERAPRRVVGWLSQFPHISPKPHIALRGSRIQVPSRGLPKRSSRMDAGRASTSTHSSLSNEYVASPLSSAPTLLPRKRGTITRHACHPCRKRKAKVRFCTRMGVQYCAMIADSAVSATPPAPAANDVTRKGSTATTMCPPRTLPGKESFSKRTESSERRMSAFVLCSIRFKLKKPRAGAISLRGKNWAMVAIRGHKQA